MSEFPNSAFKSEIEYIEWRIRKKAELIRESQGEVNPDKLEAEIREDRARLEELRREERDT